MARDPSSYTDDQLETLEECEYIPPDLAYLFASAGKDQPDGIFAGDGVSINAVGTNLTYME